MNFFIIPSGCVEENFEYYSASNRIQQHHFATGLQNGVIIGYRNRQFYIGNKNRMNLLILSLPKTEPVI
jgi:hypothetical protein